MTQEEAKEKQAQIAKQYDLSYWYGTNCEKCCGVYPKFKVSSGFDCKCWYECEVCGKRTEPQEMPWICEKKWNNHEYAENQISMIF